MTFSPPNSTQSFLPTSIIIPPVTDGQHNLILTDYLKKMIQAINDKDIAQYVLNPIVTGQKFFNENESNQFRSSYRQVINFGALPNATTSSQAHQITVDSDTIFTRIYGTATDPDNRFIPLPYINTTTPADSVEIDVDNQNVNITTTTANYVGFTTCYVILEYIL